MQECILANSCPVQWLQQRDHKRRGFCKADIKAEVVPEQTPEPIVQQKPKPITDDTVNDYIKQNPDIVTNYLRNERAMKAQRKQMNARSLLNNAF